MTAPAAQPSPRRVFSVANVQFDESRQELSVDGVRRPVEAKPLALLHALLLRAGTVVSKRTLIEAAWGNADHISEASLTTAMSKLRAALGDGGRDLIEVVHGSGYRINAPVEVSVAREAPRLAFSFAAGEAVPGRPQWRLEQLLGAAPLNDVWLARHVKTNEARVFKFADSAARLDTLQREATLSRILQTILGTRDDIVRIIEWNFDTQPYFIESAYGGPDLPGWAARQGGLGAVALQTRLAMVAQVAASIAAAHTAGVLHSDIKPGNILVADEAEPAPGAVPRLRLVDFGAGGLSDVIRLDALAISLHGLHDVDGARGTGTLRYMAPEVLAGGPSTTAADIYALGILLYQMVTADLTKALSVGWEADIEDPLLRADIAAAAAGDPARRLESAAALAERLSTLPARRAVLAQQAAEQARAAALARQVDRARARRPWVAAAAASMAAGLALATWFGIQAVHERDEARHRAAIAQAVNSFLTEDLFGRGNPAQSGKADETLMEAAQAAEAGIGRRLANEPLVAGSIYLSLGRAFDSRSASDAARAAFDQAVAAFDRAGPAGHADAVISRLQEAMMELLSGQPGSMDRAKTLLAQATPALAMLGPRQPEAQVWADRATGSIEMLGGDVRAAQASFRKAAERADTLPDVFDENMRLVLWQNVAQTYIRLSDFATAAPLVNTLLQRRLALNGPRHPSTLMMQMYQAQLRIMQGHAADAVPDIDRFYPIFVAVYGADHLRTLQLQSTRGQAYDMLGRYDDAAADQMAIYHAAVQKWGARSILALGTLADATNSYCRGGHLDKGLQAGHGAYDALRASFGPNAAFTQIAAINLAQCLILSGQPRQAAPLLQNIDRAAASDLAMNNTIGAEIDVMRAAIAVADGDAQQAATLLATAVPALRAEGADPFMQAWAKRLLAGRDQAAAK